MNDNWRVYEQNRMDKNKKQLRTLMCTKLRDPVDFIIAVYRKAHDQTGSVFVTVVGKEVFSICPITPEIEDHKTYIKLRKEFNDCKENIDIWEASQQEINARGIFGENVNYIKY